MLPDNINAYAASRVRKVDTQSVGAYSVDNLFAVVALVQAHLFGIGWSFAVAAGLVGLLHTDS
jgi:hypothetical protein